MMKLERLLERTEYHGEKWAAIKNEYIFSGHTQLKILWSLLVFCEKPKISAIALRISCGLTASFFSHVWDASPSFHCSSHTSFGSSQTSLFPHLRGFVQIIPSMWNSFLPQLSPSLLQTWLVLLVLQPLAPFTEWINDLEKIALSQNSSPFQQLIYSVFFTRP